MAYKYQYKVKGMHCAVCANTIEKIVIKMEGIEKVSVNFASETLSFEAKKEIDEEIFFGKVEKSGYQLHPLKDSLRDSNEEKSNSYMLWIAIFFCIVLVCIAMVPMMSTKLTSIISSNALWYALLELILLIPILYVGRGFFINGFKHFVRRHPNMDSLVAMGAGAALVYSLFSLFEIANGNSHFVHELYFESSGVIITLIFLGKQLEKRAKGKTGAAISKLLNLKSQKVYKKVGSEYQLCDISQIVLSDNVQIKVGEKIPVDGIIVTGTSEIDEAMLTGESFPIMKSKGAEVFEGTLNLTGVLEVEVAKSPENTLLSEIIKFVQSAQGSKAPIAKIADKISEYFVPIVLLIAVVVGTYWGITSHSLNFSLMMVIAVLVVACPCALGLATPTAIMVATGVGARFGVLIRNGEVLESLHKVKRVVFDKTGTLTTGKIEITHISTHIDIKLLLSLVGSLEKYSEHTLGKALVSYCERECVEFFPYEDVKVHQGLGIEGTLGMYTVIVGNKALMERLNIKVDFDENKIATVSFVVVNAVCVGAIYLEDTVKVEAKSVISSLKAMGIKTTLLTGDNQKVGEAVGAFLGVDDVMCNMLPSEKGRVIERYKNEGCTAFVGDGINDAPALVLSDVGIAIGSGTDIAVESAGVVLMRSSLYGVIHAIVLSRKCIVNIKQNLFWAFFYNILLIPIAAGVFFYSLHWKLSPMISAFAMAFSSLCVVANALRLNQINFRENNLEKGNTNRDRAIVNVELCEINHSLESGLNKTVATLKVTNLSNARIEENTFETVVEITKMNCQSCVKKVTDAIMVSEGIMRVVVDLETQRVTIDHSKSIDFTTLSERLKEQNFTLKR
ncbi:MAG: heavy metal translocating P-type ATPase [Fusobacteria bacterium]|nr:heavy metal translocating P-type ATPase [Fusobacteriota bacterium]